MAFDLDEKGRKGLEKIRHSLGRERVFDLRFGKHKDANDALKDGWTEDGFEQALMSAQRQSPRILMSARELGYRLVEEERNAGPMAAPLDTGHYRFDKYERGIRAGEFSVITAHTGAGKTTFCLDLALRLAERAVPVLFLSMEQSGRDTVKQLAGMARLAAYDDLHLDDRKDAVAMIPECFYLGVEPERNRVEQVCEAVKYAVIVYGVRFVVVDHLDYLIETGPDQSRYTAATHAVKSMQALARDLRIHVVLICQPTTASGRSHGKKNAPVKLADIAETRAARQLASNGFIWESDKSAMTGRLYIEKARYGPAREDCEFVFSFDGFRFTETTLLEGRA